MVTETMTITAGLVELKTLGARIEREMTNGTFVAIFNPKSPSRPVEELEKDIDASYKSTRALMLRRDTIKRAILASNAITTVDIPGLPVKTDGQKYTIAEVIELRKNGAQYLEKLRDVLTRRASDAMKTYERMSNEVETTARDLLSTATGNTQTQKMTEDERVSAMSIYDSYREKNSPKLINPIDITSIIAALQSEIDAIVGNTDIALSISNASTMITINY